MDRTSPMELARYPSNCNLRQVDMRLTKRFKKQIVIEHFASEPLRLTLVNRTK